MRGNARAVTAMLAVLGTISVLAGSPAAAQSTSTSTSIAAESLPGRIVFVKDGDLWVWQGGASQPLATGGNLSQPAWAPDGASLAYVYRGTNFADIFVSDDQGQSQQRLTNSQSGVLENNDWNLRPTFSPDGTLIAFASDRSSTFPVLTVMNAADGSGRHLLQTPGLNQESVDAMAWSPDGSELAVTLYNEPGPTQIALVPTSPGRGRVAQVLTSIAGGALDPAWAPNGTWLAFAGRDGFALDIYAIRPDGSGEQKLTSDGQFERSPAWSPDGSHLAFLSNRSGFFEVWVMDVTADQNRGLVTSNARVLTKDLHLDAASGISWGR